MIQWGVRYIPQAQGLTKKRQNNENGNHVPLQHPTQGAFPQLRQTAARGQTQETIVKFFKHCELFGRQGTTYVFILQCKLLLMKSSI